jgi:hypothetical protein
MSYDTSCIQDLTPPDFDGVETSTQNYAYKYFGTYNLWNNGSNNNFLLMKLILIIIITIYYY